tara:strand:- start:844 stop:1419 length:576 start_codon:yes stop_codon:yes gene_type:complete
MSYTNLPGLSKTHPMDAFGSFLHNPLANEFLPKQVNTTIYMMMLKISNGYDIYGDLKKLLVDFKKENRVELEKHGLRHYLTKLKQKIISEPSNIGLVIYCLNIKGIDYRSEGETLYLYEAVGERQAISYDMTQPGDKILTKYTTPKREEITLTIKSICRSLIKDIFKYDSEEGMKEICELCFKMVEKEFKE